MTAEFLSPLRVVNIDDCTDELITPLVFYSAKLDRVFTIPEGFRTDYASVPRLPFAYTLFGGVAKKAAVVHDFLYRQGETLSPPTTRAQADAVFREAMEITGTAWWRRYPMWLGVRVFGGFSYPDKPTQGELHDEEPADHSGGA